MVTPSVQRLSISDPVAHLKCPLAVPEISQAKQILDTKKLSDLQCEQIILLHLIAEHAEHKTKKTIMLKFELVLVLEC